MERYDRSAAAHYAAYRPPLHQMILRRVLSADASFSVGLDVGCGTGYSTVALSAYCGRTYGVDPSSAMLARASGHERVVYLGATAKCLPLRADSVDIVTFAGSLYYADGEAASEEIRRVCRNDALVLAYDFEVLLGQVLAGFDMESQASESDYDHRANLSGRRGFTELERGSERVRIAITASELAHVLLSDSHRSDRFARRYETTDSFPALVSDLQTAPDRATIEAAIYFSKYRVATARAPKTPRARRPG